MSDIEIEIDKQDWKLWKTNSIFEDIATGFLPKEMLENNSDY